MNDEDKSREQLIDELKEIRRRLSDYERVKSGNSHKMKKLINAEHTLKILFQNAPDGIYLCDLKGNFIDCNEATEKILGYKRNELIGNNFLKLNLLSSKDAIKVAKVLEKNSLGEKTGPGDFTLTRKDGSLVQVEISTHPLKINKQNFVLGIACDNTDRQRTEKRLRENEKVLSALLDNLPGMAYRCKNDENWTMLFVSNYCKELTGYRPDELINNRVVSFNDLIHSDDREFVNENIKIALEKGSNYELKYRIKTSDNKEKWVWEKGLQVGIDDEGSIILDGVIQDITDLVTTEKDNELLAFALNSAANSIVITDIDGNIEWVNTAFSKLTGYSWQSVFGKNPRILKSNEQDNTFYKKMWSTITAGKIWHEELINKRKDGSLYTEEMTITPVISKDGKIEHFIGIKNDITERIQAEEKLLQSEIKFRLVWENSSDGMRLTNEEGITVLANDTYCKMMEKSAEEIVGKPISLVYDAARHDEILSKHKKRFRTKTIPKYLEREIELWNGKKLYVELSNSYLKLSDQQKLSLSIFRDVTERKKLEITQRLQNEKLSNILEGTNAGLWEWNIKTGELYINEIWAEMIGYSLEELKPINFNTWKGNVHPDDFEYVNNILQKYIKGEADYYDAEFRLKHKNGSWIWVNARGKIQLWSEDHSPIKMSGIHIDITARKKAQEELKLHRDHLEKLVKERTWKLEEKTAKIEESQKAMLYLLEDVNEIRKELERTNKKLLKVNKELESFSYSVSHDLRAPLRAIHGFSDKLERLLGDAVNDEQKRVLGVIKSNVIKMGNLIDALLDFSRMTRNKLLSSKIDMNALIDEVREEFEDEITERNIKLYIDKLPEAKGDRKLIKQVLHNLLSNAVKFTNKVDAEIQIGGTVNNDTVEYFFKDNGAGFDMKYSDKLFKVFQRLHSSEEYEGIGIGLATVSRVINRHGGKVWAEGELGKGATFFFTLKKFNQRNLDLN
ncbi:diguanylate cyclase/phosphodiesterase (GGDEF & EAL domains) with PAS/PAC sensor(s) [hydrothermal vent metagenome]|uniref:histidine kinase n=1 Tax=hydrothermal vent metagenome TaxID=652676 RepID=A0A3B1C9K6_9ZZZZ